MNGAVDDCLIELLILILLLGSNDPENVRHFRVFCGESKGFHPCKNRVEFKGLCNGKKEKFWTNKGRFLLAGDHPSSSAVLRALTVHYLAVSLVPLFQFPSTEFTG
jgi:hypothetical protein